jgi:LysM repeat protein
MRRGLAALASFALMLVANGAAAQAANEAAGTSAGNFLVVGTGTSALSMAGATLATGSDLAAAAWNPASLARVDALQFSLSHAPLPGGATQDWVAAGGRLGASQTRWALDALFHQEGALEGRDALNNPTGSLTVADIAFGARLALPLTSALSAGFGGKWVHEALAGTDGSGFAFDAGLRAAAGSLGFALAARNLGSGMSYGGTRYDLPGVIAAGVSWGNEPRGLKLDADLEAPLHYYRDVRVGGEWLWHERVALRAGYRLALGAPADEALSGVTFGLGAGVGGTWLDYAYAPEGATGAGQHRIGLTYRPGFSGHTSAESRSTHDAGTHERATTPAPASHDARSPVERATTAPAARTTAPAASGTHAPAPGATAPPTTTARPVPAAPTAATAPTSAVHATSGDRPTQTGAPAPPQRPASVVVAEGETLSVIARRWNTTVTALMMLNDLVRAEVPVGTRLKLPPATPAR